jgi:hypothetical protein
VDLTLLRDVIANAVAEATVHRAALKLSKADSALSFTSMDEEDGDETSLNGEGS